MSAQLKKHLQRGTLAVTCLATAMLMLDIAVVNSALPYLARDTHAGLSGVQWVVDAYTLALAVVVLSAGSVADRRGRRVVFAAGTGLFTLGSLACATAGIIAVLDLSRAVQGLGAAVMSPARWPSWPTPSRPSRSAPEPWPRMAPRSAPPFAVGPAVGGALTTWLGWRAVFFINVPLGLLVLLGTAVWVRESRDPHARKLDWPGQITLSGGLFLLVLALLRGNTDGWGSARTLAELGGAGLMLVAFVAVESQARTPMLPLGFFRRPDFTAAQLAAFAISASFFALYLYMTLYLQEVLRLSALDAGLVYLPGSVLLFVVSGVSAQLGARVRPVILVCGGLGLVALGLVLMTIVGPHSSWIAILPGDLIVCVGTGLFNPALAMIALGAGSGESSGLLAGVNDAFRQGGIAVGLAVFGALLPSSAAVGDGDGGAYVAALHNALLLGAVVAAAGAAATFALIGRRHQQPLTAAVRHEPAPDLA
jgi:EmrB/QacA subfamily drug resistance transporter